MKNIMISVAAGVLALAAAGAALAEDIKVGAVLSMTGPFNTNGRDVLAGAQLYLQQHGDTVAGKQVKIIVKDDTSKPDVARRLAQELIVNDKVGVLIAGISPAALSIASLSTEVGPRLAGSEAAARARDYGNRAVCSRSPRSGWSRGQVNTGRVVCSP